MPVPCPSCGVALFPEAMPPTSPVLKRPGAFCPCCRVPLDDVALQATAPMPGGGHNVNPEFDRMKAEHLAASALVESFQGAIRAVTTEESAHGETEENPQA